MAKTWKEQGLEDVVIRQYDVLNSFPGQISLEMLAPVRYVAGLREEPYTADPDTRNPHVDQAYFSMSASGDVTAPVIYAHSGNPGDYALLRSRGIDVRGKVVLVRYSNPYSYRGFKALTAEREGAAAILIYSDPAEDGYKKGKVFHDGPWGPESHIQHGAITYDFMVPGDPLTPGWASVPGARRIDPKDAVSLPKIMALPLSWHDAKPLLEHMGGPRAPDDWQGGLPVAYTLGGAAEVRLRVKMDTRVMPNYVVESRIRGADFLDDWVILGNHRDAWVFGGVDPSSGTASLMELTRAFGQLLKRGSRPHRTLVFCSWDGEEVGLTGSTEWGEQFADELKKKGVAYLNVDSAASGPDFQASAVPSLASFIEEASHDLRDPSGRSLHAAWAATAAKKGERADTLVDTRIGSGSDHTVFLNFLGRPTINLDFEGPYGVYHSGYDDFHWMNRFGDPGYRYHALMSKLWGVLALRLANADILPLDFALYGKRIRRFVEELHSDGNLDFSPLFARIAEFENAGRELNAAMRRALSSDSIDRTRAEQLNHQLMQVEGNWLNPDGIPGRPWFKHLLYAARYTYAHLELPGLTEAVERKDWSAARQQARVLEQAVGRNVALLRSATAP